MSTHHHDLKAEAKRLNVCWRIVETYARELRAIYADAAERHNLIRQAAWQRASGEGCHEFWRHGFAARFKAAFTTGDRTLIPKFDEIAAGLCEQFPELAHAGDPAETLYDLLARPFGPVPSKRDCLAEALDQIEAEQRRAAARPKPAAGDFPFGANRYM